MPKFQLVESAVRGVLKLSILLNLLFLILFSALFLWKFDAIKYRLTKWKQQQTLKKETSEDVLQKFNKDISDRSTNGEFFIDNAEDTVNFLFLGNCLLIPTFQLKNQTK